MGATGLLLEIKNSTRYISPRQLMLKRFYSYVAHNCSVGLREHVNSLFLF